MDASSTDKLEPSSGDEDQTKVEFFSIAQISKNRSIASIADLVGLDLNTLPAVVWEIYYVKMRW